LKALSSALGSSSQVFPLDVRDNASIKSMFETSAAQRKSPDVVINAAGLALGLEEIDEGSVDEWNQMIDTNVKRLLYVTKYALPHMKEIDRGHIVNIGSIAGITSYPKGIVYAATKAAVKSISDGLRKELVSKNIRITNIQPGLVETNLSNVRFHGDTSKSKSTYRGIVPLTANDIADIVQYVLNVPEHVHINEITVTPTHQATVEVIHRAI
jgi:NADP-dependent 3-hydroxy acid dehydrogenase YdfG